MVQCTGSPASESIKPKGQPGPVPNQPGHQLLILAWVGLAAPKLSSSVPLELGEWLRNRNEHLAVSQSRIGERYEVCEIVYRGRLDAIGLTKRVGSL